MTKPATVGDNSEVESYISRINSIVGEQNVLADDLKELCAEAKAKGLDVKALKAAAKELREPVDGEFKNKVNFYIEATGQGRLFA